MPGFFSFVGCKFTFVFLAEFAQEGIRFSVSETEVFVLLRLELVVFDLLPALADLFHDHFGTHVVFLFDLFSLFLAEEYVRRQGFARLLLVLFDLFFLLFDVKFEELAIQFIPQVPSLIFLEGLKTVILCFNGLDLLGRLLLLSIHFVYTILM